MDMMNPVKQIAERPVSPYSIDRKQEGKPAQADGADKRF
jgi:hypothetical protein